MRSRSLLLLSALLLLASCEGAQRLDPNAPPQEVEITAYQWGYRPEVMRLKKNQTYRFRLHSIDVAHGFTCAELGIDVAIPSKDQGEVEVLLTPTKKGEFIARSNARSSGPGRRRMSLPIFVY